MESYSGTHGESVDELLNWPYRRFIAAYTAWQRRKLAEEWEAKKTAHIMAMYANTNMDMKENDRQARIAELEKSYNSVIDSIMTGKKVDEGQKPEMMSESEHAFMRAAARGQARVALPSMPGESTIRNLPS